MRLVSQSADGLIQAALVASLVFSPERATTAASFALASAIVIVPFSVIGPFVGVFIDRWSRRRIMVVAPLLRAAPVFLVLASPSASPPLLGGALFVTSVNRFFLATAQAVVPRLVPTEDLLAANSIATVGGTVALLVGVFAGGLVAERSGTVAIVFLAAAMWVVASARRARSAATCARTSCRSRPSCSATRCGGSGGVRGRAAPHRAHARAVGPITSIGLDQIGQGRSSCSPSSCSGNGSSRASARSRG